MTSEPDPLPGDLKRCKECGVERFIARCGIDREAWNAAMHNLGEQKLRGDRLSHELTMLREENERMRGVYEAAVAWRKAERTSSWLEDEKLYEMRVAIDATLAGGKES